MSRGDGWVTRAAVEIIENEYERLIDSHEVARRVYGLGSVKDVTPSQSASVRRALGRIWQRNPEVVMVCFKGRGGRTRWGRRDVYERNRAAAAKALGMRHLLETP